MIQQTRARLTLAVLLLSLVVPGAKATVVAHWTFEEGIAGQAASGAGSILDIAGGHDGTPLNSPVYVASGSDLGLDVNGSNQGVTIADDPLAFSSETLTVEAVVSLDSLAASGVLRQIVFRGDSRGGDDPFYLAVRGSGLRWLVEGPTGGSAIAVDIPSIAVGERLHLAGVIDGDNDLISLYVNGTLAGSHTTSLTPNLPLFSSARVSLGMLDDGLTRDQFLDGQIFEVRISDVALRPDQLLGAVAAPEPSTALILGLGLLGAGWARARRAAGTLRRPRSRR